MSVRGNRRKAHRFGLRAESLAAWYLRCKGYRILAMRHRSALGEIDILARRGATLAAVEVKARGTLVLCAQSITHAKRQRLLRALEGLSRGRGKIAGLGDLSRLNMRIDVIWIAPWRWPHHIEDAWRLE